MGKKAELAIELQVMLASDAGDEALSNWLRQNGEVVHESLDAMDDMVMIEEIDLADIVPWAKERDLLTPVPAAPRPR